jgi:hypothetical protein
VRWGLVEPFGVGDEDELGVGVDEGGAPRRRSGIGRVGGEEILRRLSTVRTFSIDVR